MRWEARVAAQVVFCAVTLALALPLMVSLAGGSLPDPLAGFAERVMRSHRFREATGYAGLLLIAFQSLLSVRKRTAVRLRGSYPGWRRLHMLTGAGLVVVIVAHTGGSWGYNLNGWLLSAFVLTTFAALFGKLAEATVIDRLKRCLPACPTLRWRPAAALAGALSAAIALVAQSRIPHVPLSDQGALLGLVAVAWPGRGASTAPGRAPGSPMTRLRSVWLTVHIVLVCLLGVLLGFHLLSVYYF